MAFHFQLHVLTSRQLALSITTVLVSISTVLIFATRSYDLSYPNDVVFDEAHFGKVSRFLEGQ
ncbi:MAG: hypothetical protein M1816_006209 [Peltula sp. TS41687]|nr:MAG: hypothetical protein M1816_006209 [Peltula sp. TS41687]